MRAFWKSFVYFLDNSRAFFSCTTTFHLCIISCSRTHWSWAMTILTHFWPRYQITTCGKSFIFWHTWIMDHWKSELKNRKQLMNAHWNFFQTFFSSTENHLISLLWLLNEFPILFSTMIDYSLCVFQHVEFSGWPTKCHISIQIYQGLCTKQLEEISGQTSGNRNFLFVITNFVIYYRKFYKKGCNNV